jgi:murein DD-endopeptidase MepM/ murein hydrolase activator NlpD
MEDWKAGGRSPDQHPSPALAKNPVKLISLSLVFLGAGFIGFAFLYDSPPKIPPLQSMRSWQEADAPPGYPVEVTEDGPGRVPEFDSRFLLLDAFERFSIPLALEFTAPLGPASGALTQLESAFGAEVEGGRLLGNRLRGSSEEAQPVRAVGNGLVVYAGEGGPEWGQVLILAHRLNDGRVLQSFYGGLQKIKVPRGHVVARGKVIGLGGGALGQESVHLHFEFRESIGIELGPDFAATNQNRLDPEEVLTHHRRAGEAVLVPAALAFRDQPTWDGPIRSQEP